MDILSGLGFVFPSFIAQVIIFLIVYLILKKFAFGPILEMLEARRARIEEGEKNLEQVRADMEQAEAKVKAMLDEANQKADNLIAEAKTSAANVREQKTQEAVAEAGSILAKAREASKLEHERLMGELKGEFGRLVVETTSKVTGKVLDDKDQSRINEETAGQIAL